MISKDKDRVQVSDGRDHNIRLLVLPSLEEAINTAGVSCSLSLHDVFTDPQRFRPREAQISIAFESGRFDTVTITGDKPGVMMQKVIDKAFR